MGLAYWVLPAGAACVRSRVRASRTHRGCRLRCACASVGRNSHVALAWVTRAN
ncbi:hypothetical protein O3G_MSEX000651 [Manduca sexta]|nr:hypothetical protein O3G_MSEX000651 [Manduca sexta]